MAKISTWTGVTVKMQSAIAAVINVTAATKANPCVLTTATNTFAVGDYVLVTAQGMGQINGKIFRVAATTSTTVTLEGEDSTLYDDLSSGTVQKITFGTTLGTLTTVSAAGGEYDKIDTTLLADTVKSNIPGMASAIEYTLESVWDVSDAGLQAANLASRNQSQRAFMIQFRNGQRVVFYGYIGAELIPGGSNGGMVNTKITISATGGQKAYAT